MSDAGTPEYRAWSQAIQRCTNQKLRNYDRYGGRGIRVCDRWLKYENFLEDMGRRPSPEHSLDRIDNNGDYEKSNCQWSTRSEQGRNKHNNRLLTHNGTTRTLAAWAEEFNLKYSTLRQRIDYYSWPLARALTRRNAARKTCSTSTSSK